MVLKKNLKFDRFKKIFSFTEKRAEIVKGNESGKERESENGREKENGSVRESEKGNGNGKERKTRAKRNDATADFSIYRISIKGQLEKLPTQRDNRNLCLPRKE